MAAKPSVGVWMGGPSGEREISLLSGAAVADALQARGHAVTRVLIGEQGDWSIDGARPRSLADVVRALQQGPEVVFPALHGPFGEDGTVQGFLETLGLPYVGSGVCASALAMNKILARRVASALGVRVAPAVAAGAGESSEGLACFAAAAARMAFPVFVKPACSGSSVGVSRVREPEHLGTALAAALAEGGGVVVETAIEGVEVSCPVLEDGACGPRALPVIEIVPKSHEFFDYEAKYTAGMTDEICPARIALAFAERAARAALLLHREFGCRSLSRSDFIIPADGEPVFLELNTLPGLTPVSLFPLAARTAGLDYGELCS
ncbi:MAG: D-alanine--D-alanine ligase, partial [Planctomycetes bacterium]|nr:D-alanine--D-alanine ligase [Planctomycetota bacterium]